jgi:hypothetical protein
VSDRDKLIFVSSNPNKAIEAERILGVPLLRVSIVLPEIQAAGVEEITRNKLEVARTKGYSRLIVEDVSLGFDELGNFPGPYVRWLLEAAGGKGLAAIAYALNNRSALSRVLRGLLGRHQRRDLLWPRRGRNPRRAARRLSLRLGCVVPAARLEKDVRRDDAGGKGPGLPSWRRLPEAFRSPQSGERLTSDLDALSPGEDSPPKPFAGSIRRTC